MASQPGVRTGKYDSIGKPAPWNVIFSGTVMLAMFTMLVALGFSVSIGLDAINAELKSAVPIGADARAVPVALMGLIFGFCACSRRN